VATARPDGAAIDLLEQHATGAGFVGANAELTTTLTRAQRGADGTYHVTALLNPPSLGRVEATIKVNGTSVEIAITSHSAGGHAALASHLDELHRELAGDHGEVQLSLSDGNGHARHGSEANHELAAVPDEDDVVSLGGDAPADENSLHVVL
jgi:flagellar hook-length control protein FliK